MPSSLAKDTGVARIEFDVEMVGQRRLKEDFFDLFRYVGVDVETLAVGRVILKKLRRHPRRCDDILKSPSHVIDEPRGLS